MGPVDRVVSFVEGLEDRTAEVVSGRDRVALAYSGGLASTLIAMIARKHCDLGCLVAGIEGSADFRAAKIAKDYLDYRIEYVRLDSRTVRQIESQIVGSDPKIPRDSVPKLIPLRAVIEQADDRILMAGFGARVSPAITTVLKRWGIRTPLADVSEGVRLSRSALRSAALSLGLPDEWARVIHRSPAVGAGIDDFLRRDNERADEKRSS